MLAYPGRSFVLATVGRSIRGLRAADRDQGGMATFNGAGEITEVLERYYP
jgi:hypothetical protein